VLNESLAERLNGKLHRLFVILLFVCVTLNSFAPMMNQVDLGFQVAQGRWMVQHFAPYSHDTFNYPNLGHPVINEYLLFDLILYAAWSLGWWGPCLLTALAYVTLVAVLLRAAKGLRLQDSTSLAIAIGLMLLFFQVAFPLRPHLATYLGVTVLGVFLLRHRDAQNWIVFWPMALLQVAWTNSHSGFVLGPAMVALFGVEVTVRQWLREKVFPVITARTWAGVFSLIFISCLINPYFVQRFYPPFFQDRLESIRAYVGEMEPLNGGMATIYGCLTLIAVAVVVLAMIRRGGAICFSFLLLALALYVQAQSVNKAWPSFGLFIPLLVLSTGAFSTISRRPASWPGVFAIFIAAVLVASVVVGRLDGQLDYSLQRQWHEYHVGRSELPLAAADWLKTEGLRGRLFHRCEDGGWLQLSGYDQGETFADTGFGKYDEAFIHEVGLVNERPALVPLLSKGYVPDFVVCNNFCFQWPYYLKREGWRIVSYDPNSSVWVRNGERADLPTVSDDQIKQSFNFDLGVNGLPVDVRLLGRNFIALHSLGLDDYVLSQMSSLPSDLHDTAWYWEAARLICFSDAPCPPAVCDAYEKEAEGQGSDVTKEFRAYYDYYAKDDVGGAFQILKNIPPSQLSNYEAELLLKIYIVRPDNPKQWKPIDIELNQKEREALTLARRFDRFDLRNGRHWEYLGWLEEQFGSLDAARAAWRKAVFYYPDDANVIKGASAFASRHDDAALAQAIAKSGEVYGQVH
jgi:hypothetical protein